MAYQDPYNHPQRPVSHGPQYSDDNTPSYSGYEAPLPTSNSYDDASEKGILRGSIYSQNPGPGTGIPGAGGPRVSRARFQGAELNKERPSSQWTQGIEPPPKSTGILRMWRKENRASWVRGGGWRTSCRLFSCCFLSFIFLFVSVILTLLLWVRPPNITLNGVSLPSNAVSVTTDGLTINFDLNISATNPNWFSADFTSITAVARYPGNNTNVFGGGSLSDIKFKGNSFTTFEFPFVLNYTTALDPSGTILADLVSKCTADEDITIDYDLTLKLKIIAVTIAPTISSSATFQCPVDASDFSGLTSDLRRGIWWDERSDEDEDEDEQ